MAKAEEFVANEMVFPNTQVLSHSCTYEHGDGTINVTLIGEALPADSLRLAMLMKLDSVGLGGTHINIRQGFAIDNNEPQQEIEASADKFYAILQTELLAKQSTILGSLESPTIFPFGM